MVDLVPERHCGAIALFFPSCGALVAVQEHTKKWESIRLTFQFLCLDTPQPVKDRHFVVTVCELRGQTKKSQSMDSLAVTSKDTRPVLKFLYFFYLL